MIHCRLGTVCWIDTCSRYTNCFRPSIQTSAALISYNLRAILDQLDSKKHFLQSAHVYPSASFPGRTQENLLAQLLRKKIGPSDEDWIKEGHEAVAAIAGSYDRPTEASDAHLNDNTFDQLWEWAGPAANNVAKEVLLSISESNDGESDESENDTDNEESMRMEGVESQNVTQSKKGTATFDMTLEDTFKFMSTGST